MKAIDRIRRRLRRDRPTRAISMRIPEDVIEELKEVAPMLGFSGYQSLIKAYISQGLRRDLPRLEKDRVTALAEGLRKRGVAADVIAEALAEVRR